MITQGAYGDPPAWVPESALQGGYALAGRQGAMNSNSLMNQDSIQKIGNALQFSQVDYRGNVSQNSMGFINSLMLNDKTIWGGDARNTPSGKSSYSTAGSRPDRASPYGNKPVLIPGTTAMELLPAADMSSYLPEFAIAALVALLIYKNR